MCGPDHTCANACSSTAPALRCFAAMLDDPRGTNWGGTTVQVIPPPRPYSMERLAALVLGLPGLLLVAAMVGLMVTGRVTGGAATGSIAAGAVQVLLAAALWRRPHHAPLP